jgi:S-adenosylmethionine hydrolase
MHDTPACIALLTDFGLRDPWVGVMKGVMAGIAPGATLIDVTHGVPPQDVRAGALHLDAAWRYFPVGTVFVCVVDPGVGTARRPVALQAEDRWFVGPDNGLFGLLPVDAARAIDPKWSLPQPSRTFHGRDLFAPVAARLATGLPFGVIGPEVDDLVPLALPAPDGPRGEVLLVDRFGNLITNLPGRDHGVVRLAGAVAPVAPTYGAVERGALVAVTGSTGRLEISARDGSAAERLRVGVGAPVEWAAK